MNWERMTMMFERLSAMQKCIRRRMTDDAGYWFFALCEIGFTKAALTRLRIIAHEDVGTGDITAATFALRSVDDAEALLRAQNDGWRLPAANAIIALSQAKKSRAADHFQCVCRGRYAKEPDREVPDFALDKHTRRGRTLGRGFDHFFTEGTKLVPDHHDTWEADAQEVWLSGVLDQAKDEAAGDDDKRRSGKQKSDDRELF